MALITAFALANPACSKKQTSFEGKRAQMVRVQLEQRGFTNKDILNAFRFVPREEFVLPNYRDNAYDDLEVPIGQGQTMDRPYDDAIMIEALSLSPQDRVLEVGTGSGYLAALMSRVAKEIYTIEIDEVLAKNAKDRLERLRYDNIHVMAGDGFLGWPEFAPFDAIVLSCSPPRVPEPLKDQLAEGGWLLLPLGGTQKFQQIILYTKKNEKFTEVRRLAPVTFAPMKGKILEKK